MATAFPNEEETIICMWQDRPCLWDTSLKEYRDKVVKQAALEEIAEAVNKSAEEIKHRLKALNDGYTKARKKASKSGAGAIKPGSRNKYYLDVLKFLEPSKVATESKSNVMDRTPASIDGSDEGDDDGDGDGDGEATTPSVSSLLRSSSAPAPTPSRKKKVKTEDVLSTLVGTYQDIAVDFKKAAHVDTPPQTADDIFGMYVAGALSRLPPEAKNWVIRKFNMLLYDAQTGAWRQPGPQSSFFYRQ